jgi:mRNA interferase RelE/StbE
LAWTIELTDTAARQLERLDNETARRIRNFLRDRVSVLENPRSIGQRLHGSLAEFWKYRVGDYRIIASIKDDRFIVLAVRIGHRREVYR